MAYKNQKKNKKHNEKLRQKRGKVRKPKGVRAKMRNEPMSLQQMEAIISRL